MFGCDDATEVMILVVTFPEPHIMLNVHVYINNVHIRAHFSAVERTMLCGHMAPHKFLAYASTMANNALERERENKRDREVGEAGGRVEEEQESRYMKENELSGQYKKKNNNIILVPMVLLPGKHQQDFTS